MWIFEPCDVAFVVWTMFLAAASASAAASALAVVADTERVKKE